VAVLVKKFGGSSLADANCLDVVSNIIAIDYKSGHDIVVVVSAQKGETDRLIRYAKSLSTIPNTREYDSLLSSAEQASAALLSILLIEQGIPAVSLTSFQSGILTDSAFSHASIKSVDCNHILKHLNQRKVVVVAGFQGVTESGEIATLGRGGSDMTAVVLSGELKAKECQIYTDVAGVFTADPNIVPQAKCLVQIGLDDMKSLASLGAKVMQQQALDYCYRHDVALRVLSTFASGAGTLIAPLEKSNAEKLLGVACQSDHVQLSLSDIANIDSSIIEQSIMREFNNAGIAYDMFARRTSHKKEREGLYLTVYEHDVLLAEVKLNEMINKMSIAAISSAMPVAKISVVGSCIRSHVTLAADMLAVCDSYDLSVIAVSSSESRITVSVNRECLSKTANILYDHLF